MCASELDSRILFHVDGFGGRSYFLCGMSLYNTVWTGLKLCAKTSVLQVQCYYLYDGCKLGFVMTTPSRGVA